MYFVVCRYFFECFRAVKSGFTVQISINALNLPCNPLDVMSEREEIMDGADKYF